MFILEHLTKASRAACTAACTGLEPLRWRAVRATCSAIWCEVDLLCARLPADELVTQRLLAMQCNTCALQFAVHVPRITVLLFSHRQVVLY
jgi:hypothetical protein